MKLVAVSECSVSVTKGDDAKTSEISITSSPSKNVIVWSKGVYNGSLDGIIFGATNKGFVQTEPVNFSIKASSKNVFVDNKNVVLEGDETSVIVKGTNPETALTTSWSLTIKITNAGQSVMTAD